MKSAVNWFEIPVVDLDRATKFYGDVLKASLRRENFFGTEMAVLNLDGQLDAALGRVQGAGGAVLLPKTSIGDMGEIALIRDSEGNRVGFHSEK
jgi:predicted enzyme related to lactoylglutathione lyase